MGHHATMDAYRRYRTGLTLNLAVVLLQMCVWVFVARGIGLFEDAFHGIGDNLILIGATIVLYFEAHGAARNMGRRRILALLGGALLIFAGIAGGYVAYGRMTGEHIALSGWPLAIISLLAIIGNGFAFRIIHGVDKAMHDHVHKSAVAHLIGDLAISVTVFFSSVGIIIFDLPAIDSVVTLALISPWMIFRGVQILRHKDPHEAGHAHAAGTHNSEHEHH